MIFHKRAIKYRSLLRKMTYIDKGSYESSPPCITCMNVYVAHEWVDVTLSCVTPLISICDMNEWCHTWKSHIELCHTYVRDRCLRVRKCLAGFREMSHITCMYAYVAHEWVMTHILMRGVTHERVTSHAWMRNKSRHTHGGIDISGLQNKA